MGTQLGLLDRRNQTSRSGATCPQSGIAEMHIVVVRHFGKALDVRFLSVYRFEVRDWSFGSA